MINKRIIFSLLYSNGFFFLSRNFRLQKIGDLNWLEKNYSFHETCEYIDELTFILVTKNPDEKEISNFFKNIAILREKIFAPIMIGGSIRNIKDVRNCFENGADKILINTESRNKNFINEISKIYGNQAITVMLDYKGKSNNVFTENGTKDINLTIDKILHEIKDYNFGEIILHSMDKDGTGNGFDLNLINKIKYLPNKPVLLMGGAGKPEHIVEALKNNKVSGAVTANLLNFIGDGLKVTRNLAIKNKIKIAVLNQ